MNDVGDLMQPHGLLEHVLRQPGVLPGLHSPGHDEAGVDVDDDVQLEVDAPGWAAELGDVPGPDLPHLGSEEFGFHLRRVRGLVSPVTS
jgi:hypothetical protein